VVENQRVSGDKTVQRTVLYLGEINDSQQSTWRRTLEVFDEQRQQTRNLSLFPDDREVPANTLDSLQVNLAGLELRRPRPFGNCWLASELWRQLGLTEFWRERLPARREDVSWEKVLRLLVVNRLLEPGSEFRVHRHWFVESAMDELLEADFAVTGKRPAVPSRCESRVSASSAGESGHTVTTDWLLTGSWRAGAATPCAQEATGRRRQRQIVQGVPPAASRLRPCRRVCRQAPKVYVQWYAPFPSCGSD
jgi:hypothetical protein